MGYHLTNIQVRIDDQRPVAEAVERLAGEKRAYVSEPAHGWVSVYPEATENMDGNLLQHMASRISRALDCPAIAFLVHEVCVYWLFENGQLQDKYDSEPAMWSDDVSPSERDEWRGHPERLLRVAAAHATRDALAEILHRTMEHAPDGEVSPYGDDGAMEKGHRFPEERLAAIAAQLGIPRERAVCGFRDIERRHPPAGARLLLLPRAADAMRRRLEESRQSALKAQRAFLQERALTRRAQLVGFDHQGRLWISETKGLGNSCLLVLDAETGAESARHPFPPSAPRMPPVMSQGGRFIAKERTHGAIGIVRTDDGKEIWEIPGRAEYGPLWFSQDEQYLYHHCGGGRDARGPTRLLVYDVVDRKQALERPFQDVWGAFSRDPRRAAVVCLEPLRVLVVDPETWDIHGDARLESEEQVNAVAFSHDGCRLIVVTEKPGMLVVALEDGAVVQRLAWRNEGPRREEAFRRLAQERALRGSSLTPADLMRRLPDADRHVAGEPLVHPGGEWIAALGRDGFLRFWALPELTPLATHDTGEAGSACAVRQDGAIVATLSPLRVICWRAPDTAATRQDEPSPANVLRFPRGLTEAE